MAVIRVIGAGALAALMAVDRDQLSNFETRLASASASRVSHSQITDARQPEDLSAASADASRATLRAILARQ